MILINGQPESRISVSDRGLQYGDGLFETMACRDGHVEWRELHLQRLRRGCERLGITPDSLPLLEAELDEAARQQAGNCVIKIMLTRGQGGRGYRAPAEISPTRIVCVLPWPDYPQANQQGVKVRLCRHRLGHNPALAGIKHLNRLEQVLARNEWSDATVSEGLMMDISDHLIEGTMSNLFLVRQGALYTAKLHNCGVAGIMRSVLIRLAGEMGMAIHETELRLGDLRDADEAFLSNSLIGIWPIIHVIDQGLNYRHGALTKALQATLETQSTP